MSERDYSKEIEGAILKHDGITAKRLLNEVGPCGIEDAVSTLKSNSEHARNIVVFDSQKKGEETIKISDRLSQGALASDVVIPVVEISFQPCEKSKN